MANDSRTKRIRALDRGLEVVEHLSNHGPSTLRSLRNSTDLSNATLLRLLSTLQDRGWVRRNIVEGQYELAHSLGAILGENTRAHPLAEVAAPFLLDMTSRRLGLPSDLCAILEPGRIEIVESTRIRGPMAPARTGLGIRPSLVFSAHGRAILAYLKDDERNIHLDAVRASGQRRELQWLNNNLMDAEILRTRAQGYGLRDKDYWVQVGFDPGPNLGAIAVPILSETGVHGTVSVLWLVDDMSLEDVLELGTLDDMRRASARIGSAMTRNGHKAPCFSAVTLD